MTQETKAFSGPATQEDFIADRVRFWHSVTKFTTYVTVGLLLLLLVLRWWLV